MIVGMKRSGGDLRPCRRRETKSPAKADSSKSQPGGQEDLLVTGVRSGFVESGIHFQFRPELPRRLILKSCIPQELPAELRRVAGRPIDSHRGLHIESS